MAPDPYVTFALGNYTDIFVPLTQKEKPSNKRSPAEERKYQTSLIFPHQLGNGRPKQVQPPKSFIRRKVC